MIKRRKKHTFNLPEGERGEFIMTPAISKEYGVHIKDIEPLVRKRGEELGLDLYLNITIVKEGVNIVFGPESDLNLDEMELVEDSHE